MFCQQFRAETVIWLCCYKQQQKNSYFHVINEKHQNSLGCFLLLWFSCLCFGLFTSVVSEYIFCSIDISAPIFIDECLHTVVWTVSFVVCWGSKCGVCWGFFLFFFRTNLFKSLFSYIKPRFTYIWMSFFFFLHEISHLYTEIVAICSWNIQPIKRNLALAWEPISLFYKVTTWCSFMLSYFSDWSISNILYLNRFSCPRLLIWAEAFIYTLFWS